MKKHQKPQKRGTRDKTVKTASVLFLTLVFALMLSGAASAGTPLAENQTGTVSGDLYVNTSNPWASTTGGATNEVTQANTLPAYTSIDSAMVYVNVYSGSGSNNWPVRTTIKLDGNGDGDYDDAGETLGVEDMNIPGSPDGTVYWLNDHCNRVYSDYQVWYDVTGLITSTNPTLYVKTESMGGDGYDGRIKLLALTVAYNDGDTDQVHYWVLNGQDWINTGSATSTFNTSSFNGQVSSAALNTVALVSTDGTYTLNTNILTGNLTETGGYYKEHQWDVTSIINSGVDTNLTYANVGASFKMNLATLTIREPATANPPVADFTTTPTSGTSPLTVAFTDTSTNTPTSWTWDFNNDGTTDSTDQNPSWTYTTAGIYTVKLTATNAGGSDDETKTDHITVSAPVAPVADFSGTPTTGTAPFTVNFTNTSTNATNYAWDFDNNGTTDSTDTNPTWIYSSAGTYTVKLTANGPGGSDDEVKTNYVIVYSAEPPVAQFTSNKVNIIKNTAVQFTDQSTNYVTAWAWDFTGDGVTDSTEQNPTWTYTTTANYTVKLTVTGPSGTDDEVKTDYIKVTSGELANTAFPKNHYDLKNTGQSPYNGPGSNVIWTYTTSGEMRFGQGAAIGADGTIYIGYGTNGMLSAFNPDGTLKWTTSIYSGSANKRPNTPAIASDGTIYDVCYSGTKLFALNPDGSVKWSFDMPFTVSSPTIGTDGTIYVANSNALYAVNPDGTLKWSCDVYYGGYSYDAPAIGSDGTIYLGTYDGILTAINSNGTLKWSYTITGGNKNIYDQPAIGPDGTIYFGADNGNLYALNSDGSLKWTYSAGAAVETTPSIGSDGTIYFGANNGRLYALNPNGTLKWNNAATGSFSQCSATIGANGTVYIDGGQSGTFFAFNPDGTLKWSRTISGYNYVAPVIASDGTLYFGAGTTLYAFRDVAPVADFTAITNGPAPLIVQFSDTSSNYPTTWNWNFGDGNTSTEKNPTHTYNTPGSYTVTLNVSNSAGNDEETKTNYITVTATPPITNFSATPTTGFAPLTVQFTDSTLGAIELAWDFNDDGITDSNEKNPTYTYNSTGTFTVKLTATNAAGSSSEIKTDYITIPSYAVPVANFTATPTSGVSPLTVNFTNTSTNATSYAWDFNNDGTTDSTDVNPTWIYSTIGTYTVKLTATGPGGSDDEIKTNYIAATAPPVPVANFIADKTSGTAPLTVNFTNTSTNAASYAWDFNNDGTTDSTDANPTWIYTTPGTYTVKLTATGPGGSDEELKTSYIYVNIINIQTDTDSSVYSASMNTNMGTSLTLTVRQTTSGASWRTFMSFNLSSIPNGAIIDSATLYAYMYGRAGTRTMSAYRVLGPWTETEVTWNNQPSFNSIATSVTDPGSAANVWVGWNVTQDVMAYMQGTANYGWVLALSDESTTSTNQYGMFRSSEYSTTTQRPYLQIMYHFAAPEAQFTGTPTSGTTPLQVQFTDTSSNGPTSWAWNFGDGATSTEKNPTHTYTTPGSYSVSLTAGNSTGSDDEVKTGYVTVSGIPDLVALNLQVPNSPVLATSCPVSATVTNSGIGDAASFVVKLYDNNIQVAKTTITSLAAGASLPVSFDWTPSTTGNHVLAIITDAGSQIAESDENNNLISAEVTVSPSAQPDLIATNLMLPVSPVIGTISTVTVTITNQGAVDSSAFVVKLYDNNIQYATINLTGLAAGTSTDVIFDWLTYTTGPHNLSVIADANQQISEYNEANNQISQQASVSQSTLPDLLVSNQQVPGSPVVATTSLVTATVTNLGTVDSGAFVVKLYDNNTQIAKINLTGLTAGASTDVTFNWTTYTAGNHNLSIIADSNQQITEYNENNNQISQAVTVNPSAQPDLTVTDLQLPANPVAGTTYQITATITNLGTVDTAAFAVKLYDNNTQLGKINITSLAAGTSTQVTFNWTPTTGTHNLAIKADANQQITEYNENNNQITQQATVN